MRIARIAGLVAGLSLCVGAATAQAANVTLRVEGATETIVPRTPLSTPAEEVVKDGDPAHACPGSSAAGALERATGGDWSGTWFEGLGYTVDRIGAEDYSFSGAPSGNFWSLWVNYSPSQTGLCATELETGDDVLLFPDCFGAGCVNPAPLRLRAPTTATPGQPFTVTVSEYVNGSAGVTEQPAAGATVTAGTRTYTTGSAGTATVTVDGPAASLRAKKEQRIRSATVAVCVTEGQDGRCGSPADAIAPRTTIFTPRHDRVPYRRGPREIRGAVSPDPSGIRHVKLRLTRTHRGACWAYASRREEFRRVPCGDGWYFSIGNLENWSYLLPERLPPGRYLLRAVAIDGAGNRDTLETGRNRVTFRVR